MPEPKGTMSDKEIFKLELNNLLEKWEAKISGINGWEAVIFHKRVFKEAVYLSEIIKAENRYFH